MLRIEALEHVAYCLDDTGNIREIESMPSNARLVGWGAGFEPMFVAVWSYLPNTTVSYAEAIEIAEDWLKDIGWFAGEPTRPSYLF